MADVIWGHRTSQAAAAAVLLPERRSTVVRDAAVCHQPVSSIFHHHHSLPSSASSNSTADTSRFWNPNSCCCDSSVLQPFDVDETLITLDFCFCGSERAAYPFSCHLERVCTMPRRSKEPEPEPVDSTGWILDNPYAEFVLMNQAEIVSSCSPFFLSRLIPWLLWDTYFLALTYLPLQLSSH